jgi:galactitol PTS system EIIC component
MSYVMNVINYILNLGPSVMMPIIILALSLFFRMPFGRAVRAALLIGIGFVAINLVIGMLVGALGPAAQAMVKNIGINLDVVDAGWPVAAAISFGTAAVVPWIFLLGILMNVGLIAIRYTKTLDVDMWNYWHFIFTAAFVYAITASLPLSIGIGLVTELIVLKLADFTAPIVQDYYQLPGISLPHTETVSWSPVGWVLNKFLDHVPGINKVQVNPETIQKRYGVVGEPMVVGTVLGFVIGLLGFFPGFATDFGKSFGQVLTTAITLGAAMLVLPRMVAILMEGLVPLSEGAQKFIQDRFPGRDLYIGLDAAIVIGFPNNITVGLIMVPITIVLAVVMSLLGLNRLLPFTDLAVLPFLVIWANTWSRGNIVRGVINGTVFMLFILSIGSFLAPAQTALATAAHFQMPAGATLISSLDSGAHLAPFVLAFGFVYQTIASAGFGFLVWSWFIVLSTVACYIAYFTYIARGHVPGMDDKAMYVPVEAEEAAEMVVTPEPTREEVTPPAIPATPVGA